MSFKIKQGEAGTWQLNLNQDITGATVYFTVKSKKNDVDGDAVLLKEITTHSDPVNGITELVLTVDDTKDIPEGGYQAEISYKNGTTVKYTDPFIFTVNCTVIDTITI